MSYACSMTQTTATDKNIRTAVENIRKIAGAAGLPAEASYDETEAIVHIPSPSDRYAVDVHIPAPDQPGGLHLQVWARDTIRPRVVPFVYLAEVLTDLKAS